MIVVNSGNTSLREIFTMRKILLASTALVAMSVTAAQADISISGSVQFEIADSGDDAGATFVDDSNIMISGGPGVMDNGVNATVAVNITGGAAGAGVFGPHRNNAAVAGGAGLTSAIDGGSTERAKGGGSRTGGHGSTNTGNGGEGREGTSAYSGGSGVIILRYPTADAGSYSQTGLTISSTTSGSDTVLTITAGTGSIIWS